VTRVFAEADAYLCSAIYAVSRKRERQEVTEAQVAILEKGWRPLVAKLVEITWVWTFIIGMLVAHVVFILDLYGVDRKRDRLEQAQLERQAAAAARAAGTAPPGTAPPVPPRRPPPLAAVPDLNPDVPD
jgi:hypothetical protein